jgi:hypothetical protein
MVPNIGTSHAIPITTETSIHSQPLGKRNFAGRPPALHACLVCPICARDWPGCLRQNYLPLVALDSSSLHPWRIGSGMHIEPYLASVAPGTGCSLARARGNMHAQSVTTCTWNAGDEPNPVMMVDCYEYTGINKLDDNAAITVRRQRNAANSMRRL